MKVTQSYAPTSSHEQNEIEDFYDDLIMAVFERKSHFTSLLEDSNNKIGPRVDDAVKVARKYG